MDVELGKAVLSSGPGTHRLRVVLAISATNFVMEKVASRKKFGIIFRVQSGLSTMKWLNVLAGTVNDLDDLFIEAPSTKKFSLQHFPLAMLIECIKILKSENEAAE